MIKWFRKLSKTVIVLLNIVAVLALFLSYLATYISPVRFSLLALFGIAYGVILITNVIFIVFWLFVKKRLALISIIAILIGFSHLDSYIQFIPKKQKPKPTEPAIKLVSQNVKLFGWYDWKRNKENKKTMIQNLKSMQGDVVCIQEYFFHTSKGKFDTKSEIKKELNLPFEHEYFTNVVNRNQKYGIATFSKYPIVNSGSIPFKNESGNACIYTDIKIGDDTIRVYNAHVASIRFGDTDYRFMEEIKKPEAGKVKPIVKDGMGILKRMDRAYVKRARQVHAIKNHAAKSPYPVIICGDFNETPVSYSYAQLANGLTDSFRKSGFGISNTYIGKFPSYRIDYIFHSKSLQSQNYRKYPEKISDHHALSVEIYW